MELTIEKNTKDMVIINVEFDDDMDSISHPGFSPKTKHITVTKGKSNVFITYDESFKSIVNFSFGEGGSTLISSDLKQMKTKIIYFLLSQGVNIHKKTEEVFADLKLMYWPNDNRKVSSPKHSREEPYCVHLGGKFASHMTKDQCNEVFRDYIITKKEVAKTGCIVEHAVFYIKGAS